ncbi:hypothetical protein C0Z20_19300 [Trinickia symbiotica]|uniref:Uncharacterized protein n=1 Tax=Trinickia symbiotica TaxID=863227 RepID=A0A2N7X0K2_9BURK|nr:hypothetical protein C0Z20_19300 [Trinickia symbiotica]
MRPSRVDRAQDSGRCTVLASVKRGNFWGLPVNFLAFSLVTVDAFPYDRNGLASGRALWDEAVLPQRAGNRCRRARSRSAGQRGAAADH